MNKGKREIAAQRENDHAEMFERVSKIIETRKSHAGAYANREIMLMYWEVGFYVNTALLDDGRAEYGKKILPELAAKLMAKYGKSFSERNLYRMMLFATRFSSTEKLRTLDSRRNPPFHSTYSKTLISLMFWA